MFSMAGRVARGSDAIKHVFDSLLDTERMFGHHTCMVRTRVRWSRVCVLAVACGIAIGALAGHPRADAARPAVARVYVVHAGDTVWGIAVGLVGAKEDPRPMVDALIRANGLHRGLIFPGQRLVVPA
jgi:LysM domain